MKKGFTLIEILLVVVIIGILAGAILRVINVKGVKGKATDALAKSQIQEIAKGVEAFYQLEGSYPASKDASAKYVDVANWSGSILYGTGGVAPDKYFTLSYLSSDASYIKYNSKWKRVLEYCDVAGTANDDCLGTTGGNCSTYNSLCQSHGLTVCVVASTTCGCQTMCTAGVD